MRRRGSRLIAKVWLLLLPATGALAAGPDPDGLPGSEAPDQRIERTIQRVRRALLAHVPFHPFVTRNPTTGQVEYRPGLLAALVRAGWLRPEELVDPDGHRIDLETLARFRPRLAVHEVVRHAMEVRRHLIFYALARRGMDHPLSDTEGNYRQGLLHELVARGLLGPGVIHDPFGSEMDPNRLAREHRELTVRNLNTYIMFRQGSKFIERLADHPRPWDLDRWLVYDHNLQSGRVLPGMFAGLREPLRSALAPYSLFGFEALARVVVNAKMRGIARMLGRLASQGGRTAGDLEQAIPEHLRKDPWGGRIRFERTPARHGLRVRGALGAPPLPARYAVAPSLGHTDCGANPAPSLLPGWRMFAEGPDGKPGTDDDVLFTPAGTLPGLRAFADACGGVVYPPFPAG